MFVETTLGEASVEKLAELLHGVDGVFHLAAEKHRPQLDSPRQLVLTNVLGTRDVIEAGRVVESGNSSSPRCSMPTDGCPAPRWWKPNPAIRTLCTAPPRSWLEPGRRGLPLGRVRRRVSSLLLRLRTAAVRGHRVQERGGRELRADAAERAPPHPRRRRAGPSTTRMSKTSRAPPFSPCPAR